MEFEQDGDVIIEGIDGAEGGEYILPPRGIVIANTFYEKSINVKSFLIFFNVILFSLLNASF